MRKVMFLTGLFLLILPLPLSSQTPPQPRRANPTIRPAFAATNFQANSLTFSPDGQIAAINPIHFSGDPIGLVLIQYATIANPNVQPTQQLLSENITFLGEKQFRSYVFSPNGEMLAIIPSETHKKIELRNPYSSTNINTFTSKTGFFGQPIFSPDGQMLATIHLGSNHTIEILDPHHYKHLRTLSFQHQGDGSVNIYKAAFSPDGRIVAAVIVLSDPKEPRGPDRIALWNPHTGQHLTTLTFPLRSGHSTDIRALAFSPDGQILVASAEIIEMRGRFIENIHPVIGVWNPHTASHIRNLASPGAHFNSIAFHPDGQILAAPKRLQDRKLTNTILLWNPHTGKHIRTIISSGGYLSSVVFSPNGKHLAASGGINIIPLWDAQTGKQIKTLKHQFVAKKRGERLSLYIDQVQFSPNGKFVAATVGRHPVFWALD